MTMALMTGRSVIAKLPEEWEDDDASEADLLRYVTNTCHVHYTLMRANTPYRYRKLQTRLSDLDAKRTEQQQRLAQYKHLQSLMEPLKDPQVNVQPHLVTKDGELSKELDKMRSLLARVAGRINEAGPTMNGHYDNKSAESAEQRLERVLEMT